MGLGSSRQQYGPKQRQRSTGLGLGSRRGKKRRRGLFRKIRPVPTAQPIIPFRHNSYPQNLYGSRPYVPQIPYYALQQPIYPASIPVPYNNYITPAYMLPRQPPMMMPPRQYQQYQPTMLQPEPMMMPAHQMPFFQPGMMPRQVPPYMYSPYMFTPPSMGMGMPASNPYVQQQPIYNNIGVSAPVSTGMAGPGVSYPASYQRTPGKLSTDWTGGGHISPGFLGPPI